MAIAIRAITRIQDGDDAPALGAGQDGYALTWNNATSAFVATALPAAGVADHGALTGLTPDDDHTQYARLAGRAGGQTLYGGDAANDDITIHGTSNATRTTSYVILQPTAGLVGIGNTEPNVTLEVTGKVAIGDSVTPSRLESIPGVITTPRGFTIIDTTAVIRIFRFANNATSAASIELVAGTNSAVNNSSNAWWDVFLYKPSGNDLFGIRSRTGSVDNIRLAIDHNGYVGIGTIAPTTLLHGLLTSAATNAVTNVLTIGHDTSGTAANGFGAGQLFTLESSTTAAQSAARIQALWNDATHASRKADLVLTAYDTAEREGLRIRGAGSAPAIGFLGAAPAARVAHVADPSGGATVDAEARSAINSILATLEIFGFHATS